MNALTGTAKVHTPEEYLELERASFERHEYRDGVIFRWRAKVLHTVEFV